MSYRWINPGYYTMFDGWDFFTAAGGTEQIINDFVGNPLNGIGFKNKTAYFKIPQSSTVVYFSFGFYPPYSDYGGKCVITFADVLTVSYWWRSGDSQVLLKKGEDKEEYKFFHKLEKERYNRILGKIDTINGSIDLYTNGEQLYTQIQKSVIQEIGDLEGKFLGFRSDYDVLFSNFIISDEEIKPNEDVLVLPKGQITADVLPNADGSYNFTNERQKFLMEAMNGKLKDDDIVTGLAAIAYPGYSKGDDMYRVQGIDEVNGVLTEYGYDNVTSDELAAVGVSYSKRLTKEELTNYKIGLKVVV